MVEVEHGLRQRPREARRQVGVHVVVGGRVQAAAARLLDEGEVGRGVLGRAPLGRVVRDLHGAAGGAPELERLGDGGEDGLALAAHVAGVDALVAGHDPAQAQQLLGAREAARRVDEPAGHAVGAGAQGGVQQPLHARQLALGDGALGEAHDGEPQRAVADERRDVDGAARALQRRRGTGGSVRQSQATPSEPPGVVRPVLERRRRGAPRVSGAADMPQLPVTCVVTPCRTAVSARGCSRIGDVGVRVRVDEAGRDVAAAGVDDAPAAQRRPARRWRRCGRRARRRRRGTRGCRSRRRRGRRR